MPVPTPSEIIRDHREHYINRLLTRSPLLHFSPGGYRIDLTEIFKDVLHNAPAQNGVRNGNRHTVTAPQSLLRQVLKGGSCELRGLNKKILAILLKIGLQAKDRRRVNGQHALYIGYPLLFSYPPEGRTTAPILAPLFFIPIRDDRLSVPGATVCIDPIVASGERPQIRPNLLLQQWTKTKLNPPVPLVIEAASQRLACEDPNLDIAELIRDATIEALINWPDVEGRNAVSLTSLDRVPPKDQLKNWQADGKPTILLNSAVLGVADFKGQALLADLETLATQANQEECLGMLEYFLRPQKDKSPIVINEPREVDKYLVCDSDPSQEQVLWQYRDTELTVIQGPPGTGKSQTIVNLIAGALATKKKIAVFSQKRAALEVIHKRAIAEGFGELCLLLDDPQGQRAEIIQSIREIDQDWVDTRFQNLRARREALSDEIQRLEERIATELQAYYRPPENFPRYADLITEQNRLRIFDYARRPAWKKLCMAVANSQPNDIFDLDSFIGPYRHWVDRLLGCLYQDSPWRFHRLDIPYISSEARSHLENIRTYFRSTPLRSDRSLTGGIDLKWLTTSPYLINHEFGFFSEEQRECKQRLWNTLEAFSYLNSRLENFTLPESIEALWDDNADLEYFDRLERTLPQASNVIHARRELFDNEITKYLAQGYLDVLDKWQDIIKLCVLENWRQTLEDRYPDAYQTVGRIRSNLKNLADRLRQKQKHDQLYICYKFRNRRLFRDKLDRRDLLRLRGSSRTGLRRTEIRDLFSLQGFSEFSNLYPVLLANPETACSILPLERELFDLVVIDEASQMFMAEALPLIFRGKTVVIAGDSQQMPPSDFFSSISEEENDLVDEDEFDEESEAEQLKQRQFNIPAFGEYCLLDAAERAVTGTEGRRLLEIHYRSAARELIEFSNHAFYQGKLQCPQTNPSQEPLLSRPICFRRVEGHFEKGVNEQECQNIVSLLKRIWLLPAPPTTGVIVLNMKQAARIEKMLEDTALDDPKGFGQIWQRERDRHDDGEDVGFFVRSVEHVQGDERDLIILGTTYSGTSRRFGPISVKDKGRRRLNVAITRAKKGMIVLSSLDIDSIAAPHSEDISDGIFLQHFLRYARAISEDDFKTVDKVLNQLNPQCATNRQSQQYDSPFEQEVAEFLSEHGYEVVSQVGESGFRIDLAVRNSNGIGFLCGIECDGAQYHSGWKARANDIWRQKILEGKGWRIIRIWSIDWFNDRENETARVLRQLEEMKAVLADFPSAQLDL